jgi:hypothetical protein
MSAAVIGAAAAIPALAAIGLPIILAAVGLAIPILPAVGLAVFLPVERRVAAAALAERDLAERNGHQA